MGAMEISLSDELRSEIAAAVAAGEYADENDAIRSAMEEWRAARLAERMDVEDLRRLWREGVESGPGRFETLEDIKAEARRRHGRT